MAFFKHITMFYNQHLTHLRRKWLSLPLILLFPIILIGLLTFLALSIFMPSEEETIHVGLIDLDKSEETEMVVSMIEESSQLGNYIHMHALSETEAKKKLDNNSLSAYVIFPENFTDNLYAGISVDLAIVGNPKQPIESMIIKELVDSIARHIRTSQANILTIYDYATELGMPTERRNEMLFDQFTEFLLFTIGKDNVITEEDIINEATATPISYYSVSTFFIVLTIWLFSIYYLLSQESPLPMIKRMALYGVTFTEQMLAKICAVLTIIGCLLILTLTFIMYGLKPEISLQSAIQIFFIMMLYSTIFLFIFTSIEAVISSKRFRLFMQISVIGLSIIVSGAFIPTIYFPLSVQKYVAYLFPSEIFSILRDLALHDTALIAYKSLMIMICGSLLVFILCSSWKGRTYR